MRTKNNRENQKNQKGDFLTTNKMGVQLKLLWEKSEGTNYLKQE